MKCLSQTLLQSPSARVSSWMESELVPREIILTFFFCQRTLWASLTFIRRLGYFRLRSISITSDFENSVLRFVKNIAIRFRNWHRSLAFQVSKHIRKGTTILQAYCINVKAFPQIWRSNETREGLAVRLASNQLVPSNSQDWRLSSGWEMPSYWIQAHRKYTLKHTRR